METQLMAAHLPLLLHPEPADVMVIGLASGITVGAAATHGVERIKVVEVEEAMVPAARLFSEFNGNVLDDPRVEISVNDARNDLEFSADTYDVIASEPSNPWMTVAANLFTEDFFHMARTRLRPGGIFCQWLHTYYLPTEDMRSIIAAFRSAFPNVWVFETFEGVDLLLLGSDRPLELDLEGLEPRMADLRIRMDLARIDVRSPVDILPLFRLGDTEVDRLIDGAPRNTDDNARVEFSAPKALYSDTLDTNLEYLERFAADPMLYAKSGATSPPGEEVRLELARSWARRGNIEKAASEARTLLDGPLKEDAAAFLKSLNL
jgi:spermidine synthase